LLSIKVLHFQFHLALSGKMFASNSRERKKWLLLLLSSEMHFPLSVLSEVMRACAFLPFP